MLDKEHIYLVHLVRFPLSEARERLQMSQHGKSWEEAVQRGCNHSRPDLKVVQLIAY